MLQTEKYSERIEELQMQLDVDETAGREIQCKTTFIMQNAAYSQSVPWILATGTPQTFWSSSLVLTLLPHNQPGISATFFQGDSENINAIVRFKTGTGYAACFKQQPLSSQKYSATGAGALQSSLIVGLMNILVTGYNVKL